MEERKIYRGNFINFMTGQLDPNLARSSSYRLKIVEDGREHYYKVKDFGDSCKCNISKPKKLNTYILTDWDYLHLDVQKCHMCSMYPDSNYEYIEKCEQQKELKKLMVLYELYEWSQQFLEILPQEILFRISEEIGRKFKKIVLRKSFLLPISCNNHLQKVYRIEEFQIDSDWHLYLGRETLHKDHISTSFEYNLKHTYVVRKEKREFQANVIRLSSTYHVPDKITSAILKSCNGNSSLCERILKDIEATKIRLANPQLSGLAKIYKQDLSADGYFNKNMALKYFISDWEKISETFSFYSYKLKNELSDFILGL